jgi:V/A-type H+-transporting ATPase subunit I
MNNAMPVMMICIALGAVHLFTGLGVAAYMNIRRGKPLDAVCDQLSWFMLVVGLGLMLVAPAAGKWGALAGAAIILVTAGRAKSKNPFKRLISGLGALYGVTSWVSDLLSYMRLFGMGLATGVIGMVINILVNMVFSAGPVGWVIGAGLFVGGHLFNLAINTLGAYVHSGRLQYIEFFGKFYEDGGKPFMPLTQTNRYVYITESDS